MSRPVWNTLSLVILPWMLLSPLGAKAQTAVLGQVLPDGRIKFERVQDLVINDNRKVKIAPESLTRVEPSDARSLERVDLNRAGLLRGDGKGRIYRVNADGSTDRVIPDNFPLKFSIQPLTAQIPLNLTVLKEKKGKDQTEIAAKDFYCYLTDPDPDRAALQFVLNSKNFVSLGEQLRAMEGFAASLPDSAALPDLRRNLQGRLIAAANAFDKGGAYSSLLEAQTIALAAHRAFPSDDGVTQASQGVERRVQATLSTESELLALAAIEDWGSFLSAYRGIEMNADSFPQIQTLHRIALEERTRELCQRARAFIVRHQASAALEELASAAKLDPDNGEIPKLADRTRALAAQSREGRIQGAAAQKLPKDSPEERAFQQALETADRAIADHDFPRAEESIKAAEQQNSGAPEILLARASLLSATGNLLEAIPLLDHYESLVTDSAEREKGESLRDQVLSQVSKRRETSKHDIDNALSQGDFVAAYQAANAGLKSDADNPGFLYAAGLSAAVLRKASDSKRFLDGYLAISDSLAADESERRRAKELLRLLEPKSQNASAGTPNWFSGRKLPSGIYYCPSSLAFQVPFDSVTGFKFRMAYHWEKGRLVSIRSDFEDEKGREDYLGMATRNIQNSPRTDAGNFSFIYDDTTPLLRSVYVGAAPKGGQESTAFRLVKNGDKTFKLLDSSGYPRVVLPENPWVNLEVVNQVMGPAATIVSGNPFFNPFIWDGLHYFTAVYDDQGRVSSAKEWDADNLVKFTWDGDRLLAVAAFHGQDREAYYRRSISYTGTRIGSEEYKSGAHGGRIRYTYSKDALASAKIEDGGVHDGKTWLAHFSE